MTFFASTIKVHATSVRFIFAYIYGARYSSLSAQVVVWAWGGQEERAFSCFWDGQAGELTTAGRG